MAKKLDVEKIKDDEDLQDVELPAAAVAAPVEAERIPASSPTDLSSLSQKLSDMGAKPDSSPFNADDLSDKLYEADPATDAPVSDVQRAKDLVAKATGQIPVQSRMNTSDAISQLLGRNKQELEDAKEQRNKMQLVALLNDAGSTIGSSLAPMSGIKPDEQFTKNMLAASQQPLTDLNAKQKLAQEAALEIKAQKEIASHDPNSAESVNNRAFLKATSPEIVKELGADFNNLSAADYERYHKMLELKQKYDALKVSRDQLQTLKQDKADKAATDKQNQAMTQTQQMLESARGNPEVQRALNDRYAATKAELILNKFPDNNVDTAHMKLLVPEVVKIATGGVPSVSELEANMPNGIKQKLAEKKAQFLSSPGPSEAQGYVKVYRDYINDLHDNAQRVVDEKFKRVIESRKKLVGDDNYKSLQDYYVQPYSKPQKQEKKSSGPGAGAIVQIKGKTYKVGDDGDSLTEVTQ